MVIKNGVNTALQRPCSYCKKHLMWGYHVHRSKRYGGQLHKECVEQYDSYKDAENALMGKEATNGMHQMPRKEESNPAPHTSEEVLRDKRTVLSLVPQVPRSNREADSGNGTPDNPVLLGRVIQFPRKT